jgi:hypothetical protein
VNRGGAPAASAMPIMYPGGTSARARKANNTNVVSHRKWMLARLIVRTELTLSASEATSYCFKPSHASA